MNTVHYVETDNCLTLWQTIWIIYSTKKSIVICVQYCEIPAAISPNKANTEHQREIPLDRWVMVISSYALYMLSSVPNLLTTIRSNSGSQLKLPINLEVYIHLSQIHLNSVFHNWWLEMLLQYIHTIFLPHAAIYFVKCPSPSCSKTPPQHDAATPVLHGWDGVLRLASLNLFPPNITMVIMAKQFYFCVIRPEDISPKSTIFSPSAVANRSLAFLWQFWSSGFFLAERPFRLWLSTVKWVLYRHNLKG